MKLTVIIVVVALLLAVQPVEAFAFEEAVNTFSSMLTGYFSFITGRGLTDPELPETGLTTGLYCGNNICESNEDCTTCVQDCPCQLGENCYAGTCIASPPAPPGGTGQPTCGNNICETGENCSTCNEDCGCTSPETCQAGQCIAPPPPPGGTGQPTCGDGTCDTSENCATCVSDCGCTAPTTCQAGQCIAPPPPPGGTGQPTCGDGTCDANEDCSNCQTDCACASNEQCQTNVCVPITPSGTGTPPSSTNTGSTSTCTALQALFGICNTGTPNTGNTGTTGSTNTPFSGITNTPFSGQNGQTTPSNDGTDTSQQGITYTQQMYALADIIHTQVQTLDEQLALLLEYAQTQGSDTGELQNLQTAVSSVQQDLQTFLDTQGQTEQQMEADLLAIINKLALTLESLQPLLSA